jgi:hypothetical protein
LKLGYFDAPHHFLLSIASSVSEYHDVYRRDIVVDLLKGLNSFFTERFKACAKLTRRKVL